MFDAFGTDLTRTQCTHDQNIKSVEEWVISYFRVFVPISIKISFKMDRKRSERYFF